MAPVHFDIPVVKDLTVENITENVQRINSGNPDPRFKYVLEVLVKHLHDFARESRLSTEEWMAGIQFLTEVGQICTDVRQEFIFLSDVLGLSMLVDSIDHPKPPASTEGTVLGPFHTHDAEPLPHGSAISHDPNGVPCLVVCSIKDTNGDAIADVKVDIWEADSDGKYDVQYTDRDAPEGRAVLKSDDKGEFWFKAIIPDPYPIPYDGPVGKLLEKLKRHPMRPSHMHFMLEKPGYDHLITALYFRGDPYETSDAVFGVKDSLVIDIGVVDVQLARKYNVDEGVKLITYEFILVSEEQARLLREEEDRKVMQRSGRSMKLYKGLPVPDVD